MYSKTTELQSATFNKLNTPRVKLELQNNYRRMEGASSFINMGRIYDSTVFKNYIIVAGASMQGNTANLGLHVYTADGGSLVFNFNLNARSVYGAMDFVNTGLTLVFYYATGGATMNVRKLVTSNGNFGDSEYILDLGAADAKSLSATGFSRIYVMTQPSGATTFQGLGTFYTTPILSYTKAGTTFIGTTILSQVFFGSRIYAKKHLGDDDLDRIAMIGGYGVKSDSLFTYKSDGINVFNFNAVFSENDESKVKLNGGNMVQGGSRYILKTDPVFTFIDQSKGASYSYNTDLGEGYLSTSDFENWQAMKILGVSTPNSTVLVPGISNLYDFAFIGTSSGSDLSSYLRIVKGESRLNISDNMIQYANVNNERINITIGNYR